MADEDNLYTPYHQIRSKQAEQSKPTSDASRIDALEKRVDELEKLLSNESLFQCEPPLKITGSFRKKFRASIDTSSC